VKVEAWETAVKYPRKDAKGVFGKMLVMYQQYAFESDRSTAEHEEKLSQRCQVWRNHELVSFLLSSSGFKHAEVWFKTGVRPDTCVQRAATSCLVAFAHVF